MQWAEESDKPPLLKPTVIVEKTENQTKLEKTCKPHKTAKPKNRNFQERKPKNVSNQKLTKSAKPKSQPSS